jgi:hypothetical protein
MPDERELCGAIVYNGVCTVRGRVVLRQGGCVPGRTRAGDARQAARLSEWRCGLELEGGEVLLQCGGLSRVAGCRG